MTRSRDDARADLYHELKHGKAIETVERLATMCEAAGATKLYHTLLFLGPRLRKAKRSIEEATKRKDACRWCGSLRCYHCPSCGGLVYEDHVEGCELE